MKVYNLENNNGNKVRNQFEIFDDCDNKFFQSYDAVIVKIENCRHGDFGEITRKIYLDERYWNYSKTTSKYRNMFLNEDTKQTERKIKEGVYTLTNLN
jgi:hypothetical protein